MQPDLTVSIISSDNLNLLLPCLRSAFEGTHEISLEVYVVDNASMDNTTEVVKATFPQVTVIRNEVRQGFSTNNNMVLHQGRGRYLMLLNDDTMIQDSALDHMVEFMDAQPRAGAVGGFLLNPDGSSQPAFARFPHPMVEAVWPVLNWYHHTVEQADHPFEVDSVHGAAMLVRRGVINRVGLLDTAFDPIYSEEVDWCYRIKQAGWQIYTHPQARIIHYGGQTMNRIMPRKYELLLSHRMLYFRKHAGRWAADVYRVTLGLSTAVKLVCWTLIDVLQGDRQAIKEKRKLHWYILKRLPSL